MASLLQYLFFLAIVVACTPYVGGYLYRVFFKGRTRLDFLLCPVERVLLSTCGVDPDREMTWGTYAVCFLLSGFANILALYALLRLQQFFPGHDAKLLTTPITPDLGFNTAVSFSTTTTWQAYTGENTLTYFSQIVGLAVGSFMGGAAGLSAGIACIRGLARQKTEFIGNYWVDFLRSLLWVLLPASVLVCVLLVWQGVPMNLSPYTHVTTLEGPEQILPQGPVVALECIKNLGTNGGGFFAANGSHPFECPTPLANIIEMLSIVMLPAGLTFTLGKAVSQPRQGWILFWCMLAMFVGGVFFCHLFEGQTPAYLAGTGAQSPMEGKEVRFGLGASVLTSITTSNGSCGSYNAQMDSFSPMGNMVTLVNLYLGEIIFGGLGTGLYSILLVAFLALFMAGLMVGRTPEYLGKQIGVFEMKMITLYTLTMPLAVLLLTAVAVLAPAGLAGLTTNTGPHGLTEIAYAYASCFDNNGISMGGLTVASPFYNITTVVAMVFGRFLLAIPALALFGSFARQGRRVVTIGTLPTDTLLFGATLVGVAIIVVALSYFPILSLGPLVEHLQVH